MCGNTIGQDRRFLVKYMPRLEAYFHYRNLDVSTLKELAKRWRPEVYNSFKKQQKHTALADVHESIDELAALPGTLPEAWTDRPRIKFALGKNPIRAIIEGCAAKQQRILYISLHTPGSRHQAKMGPPCRPQPAQASFDG